MNYDETIIKRYAKSLYNHADLILFLFVIFGILIGLLVGFVIGDLLNSFVRYDSSNSQLGLLIGGLLGAVLGGIIGQGRAFQLKLQAQIALCQAQIEKNTRPTRKSDG